SPAPAANDRQRDAAAGSLGIARLSALLHGSADRPSSNTGSPPAYNCYLLEDARPATSEVAKPLQAAPAAVRRLVDCLPRRLPAGWRCLLSSRPADSSTASMQRSPPPCRDLAAGAPAPA